ILAVLLEGECVHRKNARIAGHGGFPFGQRAGETQPHHAPLAKGKVERMCDYERENVARPGRNDSAAKFARKGWVALEPSARRACVTARRIVLLGARRLDGSYAGGQ